MYGDTVRVEATGAGPRARLRAPRPPRRAPSSCARAGFRRRAFLRWILDPGSTSYVTHLETSALQHGLYTIHQTTGLTLLLELLKWNP